MEEIDMATTPSYLEPENLSIRDQYRGYGKGNSASSVSPQHDSATYRLSENRSNAALYFEDIKQEVESLDSDHGGTPFKSRNASKKRSSVDG